MLAHQAAPQAEASELKTAPLSAIGPAGNNVEIAQVVTPPPKQTQTQASAAMPHTASDLPLMMVLGLLSLGLALALPRISRAIF